MDIKKIFGENLRYYRKKRNMTQEELSESLNIGVVHMGNMEIGKKFVSAELLEKICQTLKVSPSALFYHPDFDQVGDKGFDKIDKILINHFKDIKCNVMVFT